MSARVFVEDILNRGNLDAAGVLADWLEEQGDSRGVLLRRRWKRWRTDRDAIERRAAMRNEQVTKQYAAPFESLVQLVTRLGGTASYRVAISDGQMDGELAACDRSPREYVRKRFS